MSEESQVSPGGEQQTSGGQEAQPHQPEYDAPFDAGAAYAKLARENGDHRKKLRTIEDQLGEIRAIVSGQKSQGTAHTETPAPQGSGDPRLANLEKRIAIGDALDRHELSRDRREYVRGLVELSGVSADRIQEYVDQIVTGLPGTAGAVPQPNPQTRELATPPRVPAPASSATEIPNNPALWSDEQIQGMSSKDIYARWKEHSATNSRFTNPVAAARKK